MPTIDQPLVSMGTAKQKKVITTLGKLTEHSKREKN